MKNNYRKNTNLFFEILKEEREKELQRANFLDNKSGVIISLIIVFITIFIPLIPFKELKKIYIGNNGFNICIWFLISLLIISIFCILYSVYKFFDAIKCYGYKGVDINNCIDSDWNQCDLKIKSAIIYHLRDIINENRNINNHKGKIYTKALRICLFSLLLMIFSVVFLIIICV